MCTHVMRTADHCHKRIPGLQVIQDLHFIAMDTTSGKGFMVKGLRTCLQIALNGRYQLAIQSASMNLQPQANGGLPSGSTQPGGSGGFQTTSQIRSLEDVCPPCHPVLVELPNAANRHNYQIHAMCPNLRALKYCDFVQACDQMGCGSLTARKRGRGGGAEHGK